MNLLDVFQGMAGVTEGFFKEGFECVGVEINPKIARYGKKFGDVIVADMRTLDGKNFRGFDVIWGSPPCRDFSTQTQANKGYKNRKPPNPIEGLKLIECFRKFVDDAQPRIWLMENVSNLEHYWKEKSILRFYTSRRGNRTLWGNINFPMMQDIRPQRNMEFDYVHLNYHMRSAMRSKIPLPLSVAFAKACKEVLL